MTSNQLSEIEAAYNSLCTPSGDMDAWAYTYGRQLIEEVKRLRRQNETYQKGLLAVQQLINESGGVCRLHLNGDDAPWSELLAGGRFEDWLVDFSAAVAAIN